jgi:aspartokinase-like uncharacterized kinase
VIAGGGELADVIRAAFVRRALDDEVAHWLCVRILGVTAQWLAHLLPEATCVTQFDSLPCGAGFQPAMVPPVPRLFIFDCEPFLRCDDAFSPSLLPHSWDVTSDSIAARLAERLGAEELVLLKSDLPQGRWNLQQAADAGYVDRYFPTAASRLTTIRCVNLRAEGFPQARLR